MRERLIATLAGSLADFIADCYGDVTRNGGVWMASGGGAAWSCSSLTEDEANALDYAARRFARPDA